MSWKILVAVALFCGASLRVEAEISEAHIASYNAAIMSGDAAELTAAALALANAAVADPEHPEAGIVAFEAALTLCLAGACADALPAASFAAGLPSATHEAKLLAAFANWKANPTITNATALDVALGPLEASAPTRLTASAFRALYAVKLAARDYSGTEKIAARGVAHFALGTESVRYLHVEARLLETTSKFNQRPHRRQLEDVVHLRGELGQMRRAAGKDVPDWVEDGYWLANAWQNAMTAYFQSVGERSVGTAQINAILAGYETGSGPAPQIAEPRAPKAPFCAGEFVQKPEMRYPAGQAMRGRFGAVIVKFRFEGGEVRDPVILAAVPDEGFKEKALETVSQWRFKPSEDPAKTGCRLDSQNNIQELIFFLG